MFGTVRLVPHVCLGTSSSEAQSTASLRKGLFLDLGNSLLESRTLSKPVMALKKVYNSSEEKKGMSRKIVWILSYISKPQS